MRALVVCLAAAALAGITWWPPRVAVVEVAVSGEGVETREVVPERRAQWGATGADGKTVRSGERVEPERVITHPARATHVVADLGRHPLGVVLKPSVPGETRPVTAQVNGTRLLAECATILATAALLLALLANRPRG